MGYFGRGCRSRLKRVHDWFYENRPPYARYHRPALGIGHGLSLECGHHAFGHRHGHELVGVRDALVGRHDNALSHLRFGRRRP